VKHKKFIYFINKFLKEIDKPDSNFAGFIRVKILAEKQVAHKEWLLKKADELFTRKHNVTQRHKHPKTSFSI
jgi:hypothetical protein